MDFDDMAIQCRALTKSLAEIAPDIAAAEAGDRMMQNTVSRAELEAHPLFPFKEFRSDPAAFQLLVMYWLAVLAEALGPDMIAQRVHLAEPDADRERLGAPVLFSAWFPQHGRGIRVLFNDAPEACPPDDHASPPHSQLFISASLVTRPEPWGFPTDRQMSASVFVMEELVVIADTDPAIADAVTQAACIFMLTSISLPEMEKLCTSIEQTWSQ